MFCNCLALLKKKQISYNPDKKKGFGLIELMVSISIMVIVTGIVFARQNSFNGAVLLRGQAYEVALHLRDIQLSAVSASSDGGGDFRSILGAHFDTTNKNEYKIFRDADLDGFYDVGEEFSVQGSIDKRFEIREIRAGGIVIPELSVVFVRPNFDARFFDASGSEVTGVDVEIDISRRGVTTSGTGDVRTVEISPAGQITVK